MIGSKRFLMLTFLLASVVGCQLRQQPGHQGNAEFGGNSSCEVSVVEKPPQGEPPPPQVSLPNLSGTYTADDSGIYYMEQSGSTLWWAGMSVDPRIPLEQQWHRGLQFTNVFRGTIYCDGGILGEWVDVTRGMKLNSGTLTLSICTSCQSPQITQLASTGGFGATIWWQRDAIDDLVVDPKPPPKEMDIYKRFDKVLKNEVGQTIGKKSLLDNLKPYRDSTVVYGHVTAQFPQCIWPFLNVCFSSVLAPRVNYSVDPSLQNREFRDFFCTASGDQDADIDFSVEIDISRLERDFTGTGWGELNPDVISQRFAFPLVRSALGLEADRAFLHVESIMYGRTGKCFCIGNFPCDAGISLLPGWADSSSNSILINGRPCSLLLLPCPATNDSGIQFGRFPISADDGGTYLRITGALVLDCGHGLGAPCYDNPPNPFEQNQEIHPIYSIDVINYPFRPEDNNPARKNLTGTWAGTDGSTYYVRQVGNTIWWLGQMRDRQPLQPAGTYPMIGMVQIAPALLAGDPACPAPYQCWAFANVFKGTLTQANGAGTIKGTWAGVRQSTSAGSSGGNVTFTVDAKGKIISPTTLPSIFPDRLEKMYEPEDTTPPSSTLVIGTQVISKPPTSKSVSDSIATTRSLAASGSTLGGVHSGTLAKITATDQESGVQNIWYRFYPRNGTSPPQYIPVLGSVITFALTGSDGAYVLDYYATDNAGNDETPHSQGVLLNSKRPDF